MVEHENETLRDRVSDLERRVHDQNDEITCLRATLADALRRINTLEAGKDHVQVSHRDPVRLRRGSDHVDGAGPTGMRTPSRRPISGTFSTPHHHGHHGHHPHTPGGHDTVGRSVKNYSTDMRRPCN